MKSPKDVIKLNKLVEDEKDKFKSIAKSLLAMEDKGEISERMIREVHNVSGELKAIADSLTWKLINALKQGYELDEF